jgi:hypothetical protein
MPFLRHLRKNELVQMILLSIYENGLNGFRRLETNQNNMIHKN